MQKSLKSEKSEPRGTKAISFMKAVKVTVPTNEAILDSNVDSFVFSAGVGGRLYLIHNVSEPRFLFVVNAG